MEPQIELCGVEKTNEWRGVPASRHKGVAKSSVSGKEERERCGFAYPNGEEFSNDFVLGNKANHAQRTATITYQRIDLRPV